MTFEKLCEIGVRQQEKAMYKDWAFSQKTKTCERCCNDDGIKMSCNCCDECPVTIAYQKAIKRIDQQQGNNRTEVKQRAKITSIDLLPKCGRIDCAVDENEKSGDLRDLDIPLTLRIRLEASNITTISDVANMSDEDLMNIKGIGKTSLNKIRDAIEKKFPTKAVEKKTRNKKMTVTFESKFYTPEEWKIIKIIANKMKGGN